MHHINQPITLERIESAMMTVAQLLPENADLGSVWERLHEMWTAAKANERKTTKAQDSAFAWLSAQKDIASNATEVSSNDSPAP